MRQTIPMPKVMYKVDYKGLTHYLLGSMHTAKLTNSVKMNQELEAAMASTVLELQKSLIETKKVKKVYLEYADKLVLAQYSAKNATGTEACLLKGNKDKVEFCGLENPSMPESWLLILYGSSSLYRGFSWCKDRFPRTTTFIWTAHTYALWVLIPYLGSFYGFGITSSFNIWGVLGGLLLCINHRRFLKDMASHYKGNNVVRLAEKYVDFFKGRIHDYQLDKESCMIQSATFLATTRNTRYVDVLMEEKDPSLVVYGMFHNLHDGKTMLGVPQLLEAKGATVTGYDTFADFKQAQEKEAIKAAQKEQDEEGLIAIEDDQIVRLTHF